MELDGFVEPQVREAGEASRKATAWARQVEQVVEETDTESDSVRRHEERADHCDAREDPCSSTEERAERAGLARVPAHLRRSGLG